MSDRWRSWIAVVVIGASLATIVAVLATDAPSAEDRVASLAGRLKCPVCASETIADSPSDLARDLLDLIAEQVAAGWTDREVIDFFITTYGDEVLLDPPASGRTALLWVAPLVALAFGIAVILARARRRAARDLTDVERRRVDAALEGS